MISLSINITSTTLTLQSISGNDITLTVGVTTNELSLSIDRGISLETVKADPDIKNAIDKAVEAYTLANENTDYQITNLRSDSNTNGQIPDAQATWLGATAKSVLSYIANISSKLYYSIYPQPQTTSETGTFQLTLTHLEIVTQVNSATDCLCNIPLNDTVAFPIGSIITIEQLGVGVVTATAISGVTLNGDPKTQGQYKFIQLWKTAINTWVVIGGTT